MEKSNRICRTCLKSSPTMVPLFKDTSLCRKILAISSILLVPGGNLPTVVCVQCVLNINSAFKFRQVLINTDARLKAAIIKNVNRRLSTKNTRDPLALSSEDNKNLPSQKQALVINLAESTPVTPFTIDFNPFKEESLQSNNVGVVGDHPAPTAKETLNDETAVLPRNLNKFPNSALKRTPSPGNHKADIEQGCETIKTEENIVLREEHQPESPIRIDSPLKGTLSAVNHNTQRDEGTIKTEANVALPENQQPLINTSRINRPAKISKGLVKDFLCQVCGKLFSNTNFTRHFLNHTEAPVNCKVCGKAVKNIINLRFHMKMHGPPVTTCEYCGKSFNRLSSYRSHLTTHTGSKNYKCRICFKSFANSSTLKRHKQTHTGERPYSCKYCKKGFTSRSALKTHIRQHTNENPYTCDHCSMGFHQKVSLTTHLKSKHNKVITA